VSPNVFTASASAYAWSAAVMVPCAGRVSRSATLLDFAMPRRPRPAGGIVTAAHLAGRHEIGAAWSAGEFDAALSARASPQPWHR
jgi:hypothetical protein